MKRVLRSRWPALGAVAALLAVLGFVGTRPLSLDPEVVESQLSELVGGRAEIEGATWHWVPEPTLVVLQPRVERRLGPVWTLKIAAHSGEAVGLGLFGPASGPPGLPDQVELRGLSLNLGPLDLLRGRLSADREESELRLRGHAFGRSGGRIDLRGRLEGSPWNRASGQLYLEDLETVPWGLAPAPDSTSSGLALGSSQRSLRLNGVVSARPVAESVQRFDVHLEVLGVQSNLPGSWLSATVEGVLEHSQSGWAATRQLDLSGKLGFLAGDHRINALEGQARGALRLAGSRGSERAELEVQLSDLRGRIGTWLDSGDSERGRLRATGWLSGGRVEGTFELGRVQLDIRRDSQGAWVVHSGWLPLSDLRPFLPSLQTRMVGASGRVRLAGSFDPARGWTGEIEAREISLPVRDVQGRSLEAVELASARLRIRNDSFELEVPKLFLGGEGLQLRVRGENSGQRPTVSISGTSDSLDLRRVAPVLAALFGAPDTGLTLEAILVPIVRSLRRYPSLLARLVVHPSILRVKKLQGLGLDSRNAAIRIALRDQKLELGCRAEEKGKLDVGVRVDLEGWVPRILGERRESDAKVPAPSGA